MTDMAGNILYSDPTNPQVFTIISNNGQYTGIITYFSREAPPPPRVWNNLTHAAHILACITGADGFWKRLQVYETLCMRVAAKRAF